jgi:hypothetical protein
MDMFSTKADAPFSVHVPAPADDRPSWTRVGVIAAIGFLVGVAWPKLAGVRLGPSLPETASSAAASASSSPVESVLSASPPSASSVAAVAATPVASTVVPSPPAVSVSHGTIFSCKSADGDPVKGSDCGSIPGLDNVVLPRLRKLAECADATQVSGKLHFVVRVDFSRMALAIELGKNPGFAGADAILACAKEDFTAATPPTVPHDNPRYGVAYTVTFGTSGTTAPAASVASTPAASATAGTTQIVWDVAIVRDTPKTGKVVARLQRGTTLQIGTSKDGWYPVKFGDGFTSEGWVYRGAIGR